jgi:hypothetical protein
LPSGKERPAPATSRKFATEASFRGDANGVDLTVGVADGVIDGVTDTEGGVTATTVTDGRTGATVVVEQPADSTTRSAEAATHPRRNGVSSRLTTPALRTHELVGLPLR